MAIEKHLVAYCDILGTKAKVKARLFHPFVSLDFANPVGIVAAAAPDMRFAVFSDSAILSAPATEARRFVSALAFVCTQWNADGIMVRGAVAFGEINWVDDWSDEHFRRLKNLSLSRVYGRALVKAFELEQTSGAGAVIFVHPSARGVIRRVLPDAVRKGNGNPGILNWMDAHAFEWMSRFFALREEHVRSRHEKRHVKATLLHLRSLGRPGVTKDFHYEAVAPVLARR